MKRFVLTAALICMSIYASAAQGGMIAMPPPGPARVANTDAVVVGKVESIEPQDIKAGLTTYRIAIVRINDGIRGAKDEKTVRIGFIPIAKPVVGKGPFVVTSGARPIQLDVGQEGLFLLTKQAKDNFYTIGGVVGYYINSDKNKDFEKEVLAAKAAVKVMDNPQGSLKSKDADERLLAAAILIDRARTYRGPNSKQEPIDAAESKLILQVLADSDWQTPYNFSSLRPIPGQLFQRLNVTAKDGFVPPPGGNYQAAAQAWVRDNAQKYRIQRFVAADAK
jgi:hypothetical protein